MKNKILSDSEAIELMFNFLQKNLTAVDNVQQQGGNFLIKKNGIDILLKTTHVPLIPADDYTEEVKSNSRVHTANGLIMLRSAGNYDGKLLRQAVYLVHGKNKYYKNQKNLTEFEQKVAELYGAPVAYFNPKGNDIDLIGFIRTHGIPEKLQPEPGHDGSEQPKEIRQKRHIHEGIRDRVRKISIKDEIKGDFTLDISQRKSTGVLIARIVPYSAQQLDFYNLA